MSTGILKYFSTNSSLPAPSGQLSRIVPSRAIVAANLELRQLEKERSKSKKRGTYHKYTPKDRADIAKYAKEYGVKAAKRRFSRKLRIDLNFSTISMFKKSYEDEVARRRAAGENDTHVKELQMKTRGRPVILGEKLDLMVQKYILSIREKGGTIDTSIVVSAANGIVKSLERSRLAEYGGPVQLTRSWARSVLRRMNFTKRKGTTKSKISMEEFREVKKRFLKEIIDTVDIEGIPPELIFNWDQTGINLVPSSSWTMELKGSRRVEIKGMDDKRQITCVFCVTILGDVLPTQVIYGGKTDRCHPLFSFPEDWLICHSQNHWSNENTMLDYVNEIIVPYVDAVRENLSLGPDQAALAIFDHFKGQLTPAITQILEDNNIQSVLVPAGCTDRLQPLDVSVNKSVKSFMRAEFQRWYSNEITTQLSTEEELQPVDLSTARMKCLGAQWLVRLQEYLSQSPHIVVNGFIASGITPSIDVMEPVLDDATEDAIDLSDSDSDVFTEDVIELPDEEI